MVGVGQGLLGDIPGLLPPQVGFIQQNPHQLGNGQGRVRVVQLDGDLFRQRGPISVAAAEAADEVGQGAGDQKILLHEAQPLPHAGRVVGIEHPGEGFGLQTPGQRTDEFAVAEDLKVEVIGRRGGPQAQRPDGLARRNPPPGDRTGSRKYWTPGRESRTRSRSRP